MRIPARPVLPFLVAALLATACSGNSPPAPNIAVAGWSWDPAQASDRPLPVIWWNSSNPEPLELLPGSDCASGSVHGIAMLEGVVTLAGFQAVCSGAGSPPRMRPVVWTGNGPGTFVAAPLVMPDRTLQGTALAVTMRLGDDVRDVFVGGAAGTEAPFPMVWKNGLPSPAMLGAVPAEFDSGVVTSIGTGENFVAAGAVMHVSPLLPSDAPSYRGVVWVLDPSVTFLIAVIPLDLPPGVTSAGFGPSVPITVVADSTLLATAAISGGPGLDKPVVWADNAFLTPLGVDFTVGPYGVPTGFSMVGGSPYLSGFVHQPGSTLPAPILWAGEDAQTDLSTSDPSLGLGAGEAIAILYEHAYPAGETYRRGTSVDGPALVSVPAYWNNGNRHDLAGLVAEGNGPVLSQPLFGWWRLPGTPLTDPPNWPYTGGFAEVSSADLAVAAAGSGVAKAILVFPK
jgi:hypothetical protein